LFKDNSAMFFFPNPGMFQELFAGKARFFDAILLQLCDNFSFGGDGSVIGSGQPKSVFALHPGTPYKYIL